MSTPVIQQTDDLGWSKRRECTLAAGLRRTDGEGSGSSLSKSPCAVSEQIFTPPGEQRLPAAAVRLR